MVIKEMVIHRSVIQEWASRESPPVDPQRIENVLSHISKRVGEADPENVLIVEAQVGSDEFNALPDQFRPGDEVRLMGARAGYCMKAVRELLEGKGIKVKLDEKGSLD